ncbi:MAG: hypothetical protein AAF481_20170 [Acidobacteriota bacterium]
MNYRVVLSLFVLLLSTFGVYAQESPRVPSLEITRADTGVTVTGVTPGAEVVLLGVGRSRSGFRPVLETWPELLADDNGDGSVTLLSEIPFPELSAWGAVDLASGETAILEVPDLDALPVPLRAFASDGSRVGLARRTVEVLWARPGAKGEAKARASVGTIGDGGSADADGKLDRRVTFRPRGLRQLVGPEERNGAFAGGDVLIVVDSETLEMAAVTVPASVAAPVSRPAEAGQAAGGAR